MTEQELLDHGFSPHGPRGGPHDKGFYQSVVDPSGKRYFFEVRFWRHSQWGHQAQDSWDAEGYLQDPVLKTTFSVVLHKVNAMSVQDVKDFFRRVWTGMGRGYLESFTES